MGSRWVPMPDLLWGPTHFWADAEFAELHNKLLCNGLDENIAYGMQAVNPEHWPAYQALIEAREAEFQLWGYKDFWLPVLWPSIAPRFTNAVKPIFLTRDPNASLISYATRKGFTVSEASSVLQPFRNAVAAMRAAFPSALTVHFDELTAPATKAAVVAQIAAEIGMPSRPEAVDRVQDVWVRF